MRSFLFKFCIWFVMAYIHSAEGGNVCGIQNNMEMICSDPELPHCCGYTDDGQALCCANRNNAFSSLHGQSPEYCGSRGGHQWYCAGQNSHCCGFSADGKGICCDKVIDHKSHHAESCGMKDGIEEFCPDLDMPHCCGFHGNETLCCNKEFNPESTDAEFCGDDEKGTRWFCPDPIHPRCCGFNDEGQGMCCAANDNKLFDRFFRRTSSSIETTTSNTMIYYDDDDDDDDENDDHYDDGNDHDDNNNNHYVDDNYDDDYVNDDDDNESLYNDIDSNPNYPNQQDDQMFDNNFDTTDGYLNSDSHFDETDDDSFDYVSNYNNWYIWSVVGTVVLIIFAIVLRVYLCSVYRNRLMIGYIKPVQSTSQKASKTFKNPIQFAQDTPSIV